MCVRVIVILRAVGVPFHAALELLDDLARDFIERVRGRRRRIEDHDRLAGVAADDDLRIDRHFSEEWDAEHLRGLLAAAVTEDLFALAAVAADEIAHVLDDAE